MCLCLLSSFFYCLHHFFCFTFLLLSVVYLSLFFCSAVSFFSSFLLFLLPHIFPFVSLSFLSSSFSHFPSLPVIKAFHLFSLPSYIAIPRSFISTHPLPMHSIYSLPPLFLSLTLYSATSPSVFPSFRPLSFPSQHRVPLFILFFSFLSIHFSLLFP